MTDKHKTGIERTVYLHTNGDWYDAERDVKITNLQLSDFAPIDTRIYSGECVPEQPEWTKQLDSREWSQVLHAQAYARNHIGAGAPGHGQFLLIAKLAQLLNDREARS